MLADWSAKLTKGSYQRETLPLPASELRQTANLQPLDSNFMLLLTELPWPYYLLYVYMITTS